MLLSIDNEIFGYRRQRASPSYIEQKSVSQVYHRRPKSSLIMYPNKGTFKK